MGHHFANILLAPAIGAAVDGRRVKVVDAEVEGALDDGDGDVEVVGPLQRSLAAQRKDAHLVAGLAQVAGGHGFHGARILRERGHGFRGIGEDCRRREQSGCDCAAGLEEIAAAGLAG